MCQDGKVVRNGISSPRCQTCDTTTWEWKGHTGNVGDCGRCDGVTNPNGSSIIARSDVTIPACRYCDSSSDWYFRNKADGSDKQADGKCCVNGALVYSTTLCPDPNTQCKVGNTVYNDGDSIGDCGECHNGIVSVSIGRDCNTCSASTNYNWSPLTSSDKDSSGKCCVNGVRKYDATYCPDPATQCVVAGVTYNNGDAIGTCGWCNRGTAGMNGTWKDTSCRVCNSSTSYQKRNKQAGAAIIGQVCKECDGSGGERNKTNGSNKQTNGQCCVDGALAYSRLYCPMSCPSGYQNTPCSGTYPTELKREQLPDGTTCYLCTCDAGVCCPPGACCPSGKNGHISSDMRPCPRGYWCGLGTNDCYGHPCREGTYGSGEGLKSSSECTQCPAGKACPAGSTGPTTCGAGTYLSSNKCVKCPAGYYCPNGKDKNKCGKGYYCPAGASSRTACPAGKYSSSDTANSCSNCTAGYYCPGASDRQQCGKGNYCPTGSSRSTACPAGQYSTSATASSCTKCTAGYYCPGGSDKQQCGKGNYCPAGSSRPKVCPAGQYSSNATASSCTKCNAGYYCRGGSDKQQCGKGNYCPAGSAWPTACPAGQYSTSVAASSCTKCTAGYYCPGGSDRRQCGAGNLCPAGSAWPTVCPAGTYSTSATASSCTKCTAGYYCPGGSDRRQCGVGNYCPAGSTQPKACGAGTYSTSATASSCTKCTAGYYCPGGSDRRQCGVGNYCPAGSTQPKACGAGTYSTSATASSCTNCPRGSYCPGGTNKITCPYRTIASSVKASSCTACATNKCANSGHTACNTCNGSSYKY